MSLTSVDGSNVVLGDFEPCTIRLGRTDYSWKFFKAAVQRNILGADFLAGNALVVDMKAKSLVAPYSTPSLHIARCKPRNRVIINATFSDRFYRVLAEFPRLTVLSKFPDAIPHSTRCKINTIGEPVYHRQRPLNGVKLAAMLTKFETLLKLGIVQCSLSPWALPLHFVPKADGQF